MADETDRKPLSLNERNQLLLQGLSRSRPSKPAPTEIKVRKVKLQGHRRLCKFRSPSKDNGDAGLSYDLFDSPVVKGKENDGGGESIRDILDDLSFRLESLSVEKPKERPRPEVENLEPVPEFKSALEVENLEPVPEFKSAPEVENLEPVPEFKSAPSSLSPPSDEERHRHEVENLEPVLEFKSAPEVENLQNHLLKAYVYI